MVNKKPLSCFALLSLALVLAITSSLGSHARDTDPTSIKSIVPDMSTKELKVGVKLFLTKMKLRRVPLAKARSEKLLSKLYREERIIQKEIEDLKNNLQLVGTDPSSHEGKKVLETRRASKDGKRASGPLNLMVVSDLTQGRIDEWRTELANKEHELEEVQAKKDEAKNIIKNPESYISIPTNYGREEPEDVQERERELLINDRLSMNYRAAVEAKEEPAPAFLVDEW